MALTNKLSAIGDAIRAKTGKSEKLTLDSMVTEINSITTGGSGGGGTTPTLEDYFSGTMPEFSNEDITEIMRDNAFFQYFSLKKINLPNIERVGNAFLCMSGVVEIDFPKLKSIKNYDFCTGCHSLQRCSIPLAKSVCFNKGLDFSNCEKLTSLDISSLEAIHPAGFQNCYVIPKIDLPSVSKIYSYNFSGTFEGCHKLTALILRNPTPVILDEASNLFKNCPINIGGYNGLEGYIYVPKALVEQYKVATNWVAFADKFRAIEDYPEICGGA